MANSISFFPIYSTEAFPNVFDLSRPYTFHYYSGEILTPIKADDNGILKEPPEVFTGEWMFDVHIRRVIRVKNASVLFGPNGLACSDAKIGLCVLWMSPSSHQRGIFKLGEISNCDEEQVFSLENSFLKASSIRGNVTFKLSLYIMQCGAPQNGESHLANTQGFLIGDLDEHHILFDGFTEFPIYNCSIPNGPLWDVACSWEDVNDKFLDTVFVNFNTENKLFKYVDRSNTEYFDINLVREIVGSALLQIIERYRESDENFSMLDSAPEGSVAAYVKLYINGWNVDCSSFNTLSRELRKRLEEKIAKLT